MATPLEASTRLLIGQWLESPRLRGLLQGFLDDLTRDVLPALDELVSMRSIDTARGVWLDLIGRRLGLERPSVTDPDQDLRFRFEDDRPSTESVFGTFDTAPYAGDQEHAGRFPLNDTLYRVLLKARAILVFSPGTTAAFRRAIQVIDEAATVEDTGKMVLHVVTDSTHLPTLQLANEVGALPRNAGVDLTFSDRDRFGYEGASGAPFDRGPYA